MKKSRDRKEHAILEEELSIRESPMKRNVPGDVKECAPKQKKCNICKETFDLIGDRELHLMEEESPCRRLTERKRLKLDERR